MRAPCGARSNRISYEVIERNHGATDLVLAGIRTRGVYLAERMADKIAEVEGTRPQVVSLDITGFRDDHPEDPIACQLPQIDDISQKTVLIVDDVLSTGRTVRAAMEAVLHMGRAQRIQLAALIDRGHRELRFVRILSAKICRPPAPSWYGCM